MLITFHSKAAAEVLMRADDAKPLLSAAGKPYTGQVPERGVFKHDQLAAAIEGLERAIRAEDAPPPDEQDPDKAPVHPVEERVSLHQRAFPLLDMLKKSQAAGADVTWETASAW
ncbi:DUF1840 domain-containing protein [Bordetella sp. 2513F-2]